MTKLFFKSAIQNLRKNRAHSILNIIGLAFGLTAFLYIISFIGFETSFDNFHSKANRIYRCCSDIKFVDEFTSYTSEAILGPSVRQELPDIETSVRLYPSSEQIVRYQDKRFSETQIMYADESIFHVFDFELLEGDKNTALSEPYSIIITEDIAEKYFGTSYAINKTLILGDEKKTYTIKGILEKIPQNSHLQFNMLASLSSLPNLSGQTDWGGNFLFLTYILLKDKVSIQEFEKKYSSCIYNHWAHLPETYIGITLEEFEKQGKYFKHWLQPLNEIYLQSTASDDKTKKGNIQLLIILGIIGTLIIIIACVNFINLNTAKSILRYKDVGIKKILGSNKKVLIIEILSESFLQCLIALTLSLVFLVILLPIFNNYSGIELTNAIFFNFRFFLKISLLLIVLTLFSGGFLAFKIASSNALLALKAIDNTGKNKDLLQGSLVSFQFIIFILLTLSSIVIQKQIKFMVNQSPGFNKENVLVLKNIQRLKDYKQAFKKKLLNNADIISASYSSLVPTINSPGSNQFSRKGENNTILMDRITVDYDFFKTYEIKLLKGRLFNENFNENDNIIMNQKAASLLGWNDCNQKQTHYYQGTPGYDLNLIGITQNIHTESFREGIKPLVFFLFRESGFEYLSLRITGKNITSNLRLIQEQWEKFGVDVPLEYFFIDNSLAEQYKSENQLAKILNLFTVLAIIIACIGLIGLVSFMANRRQKEIGIRKVNGAKTQEVLMLLNKDYIKWVIISCIVACPIAWLFLNKWLQNFVYRITINWWIFVFTGTMTLLFTFLIVSWQSWTSANKNPVDLIKYE
ncbi:MAG: ABC transporter permease [Candidatus Odinarchaeota archaeon]